MNLLPVIRQSKIYITTKKAAEIMGCHPSTIKRNKSWFEFKRDTGKGKKGKVIRLELSSVLRAFQERQQNQSA